MTPNAEVSIKGNKLKYSQISYFMRYNSHIIWVIKLNEQTELLNCPTLVKIMRKGTNLTSIKTCTLILSQY